MSEHAVVFCPGWTGLPPKKYNPLLKRFQENGFDVVSINYETFGFGDIDRTAGRTGRVLKTLRDSYEHICLVGHSMGGLVARKTLCDNPEAADSLITLGTPHKGVQAVIRPFRWLPSIRDMISGSDFHGCLLESHDIPTLVVAGEWDLIVPDASWPGHETLELEHQTHMTLIWSQKVFYELYAWLNYEVLDLAGTREEGLYTEVKL